MNLFNRLTTLVTEATDSSIAEANHVLANIIDTVDVTVNEEETTCEKLSVSFSVNEVYYVCDFYAEDGEVHYDLKGLNNVVAGCMVARELCDSLVEESEEDF